MTVDNLLVILQKVIDISLVWMMVYFVLKNIKIMLRLYYYLRVFLLY